jgi:hypothetical protein
LIQKLKLSLYELGKFGGAPDPVGQGRREEPDDREKYSGEGMPALGATPAG